MSKQYRLRKNVPNPAGGEYPEPSEALIEQNTDASVALMKSMMARLVPLQLDCSRGNVRATAGAMAALFITCITEFLSDNRAEDQSNSLDVYDATISLMVHHAKELQDIALMRRILDMGKHAAADGKPTVQVFEIKPGQELPEELLKFLRS